jgi:hypothetical protein
MRPLWHAADPRAIHESFVVFLPEVSAEASPPLIRARYGFS